MNKIAFTGKEIAVLSQFNADAMPDAVRQQLAELNRITGVLAEAKNVAGNAATEKVNACGAILAVTFAVAEATSEAKAIREIVFNSVMGEYVTADKDSAKASLKAYVSTARSALVKLLDSTHTREQIEKASYKELREWLSPKADADFTAKVAKVKEHLSYVEKQIGKVKKAEDGAAQMAVLHSIVDDVLATAQALRDQFKAENDSGQHRAEMARALHDLRQQGPSEPTAVETRAA